MKSTFKLFFAFLTLGVVFYSCDKHEVIPPPQPLVDLKVHFEGTINGTTVEYTDDVDGFNGETSVDQYILGGSGSYANYFCNMTSNLIDRSIKIGIGSLPWDAGALDKPSLEQFNTFFTGLDGATGITYEASAVDGFEVVYTDNFGNVWTSDPTSVNPQSVLFENVELDEDNDGDYAKFKCTFSCYVYRTVTLTPLERDSLRMDNCVFEGWFER